MATRDERLNIELNQLSELYDELDALEDGDGTIGQAVTLLKTKYHIFLGDNLCVKVTTLGNRMFFKDVDNLDSVLKKYWFGSK